MASRHLPAKCCQPCWERQHLPWRIPVPADAGTPVTPVPTSKHRDRGQSSSPSSRAVLPPAGPHCLTHVPTPGGLQGKGAGSSGGLPVSPFLVTRRNTVCRYWKIHFRVHTSHFRAQERPDRTVSYAADLITGLMRCRLPEPQEKCCFRR